MTTPIFANNVESFLTASLGDLVGDLTVYVEDASVFSALLLDPVGDDYRRHQVATLTDGTNTEIIHITQIDTGANTLTVTRAQEGTTRTAFGTGTVIEHRLSAEILNSAWFGYVGNDWVYERWEGEYAIGLISYSDWPDNTATGQSSIAIGTSPEAAAHNSIAVGTETVVTAASPYGIAIGYNAGVIGVDSIAIGVYADCLDEDSVAVGAYSQAAKFTVCVGPYTSTTAECDIAIGYGADCSGGVGVPTIAIGKYAYCRTGSFGSIAIGVDAETYEVNGIVVGNDMVNRLPTSHVISGLSQVVKDTGQTDFAHYFSGQENVLFSDEIDLKVVAQAVSIAIPTGGTFYPDEVGLVITSANTVTTPATISFGNTSVTDELLAATLTTAQAVKARDRYETLASGDGQTSLSMDVTVAAVATTLLGRVYFKGIFVEDE